MGAEYGDERVSVFVCLFVCMHVSVTTCPNFSKFSVHVKYGRGSVVLWQRCDTLCTSAFVDEVIFAHYNDRE